MDLEYHNINNTVFEVTDDTINELNDKLKESLDNYNNNVGEILLDKVFKHMFNIDKKTCDEDLIKSLVDLYDKSLKEVSSISHDIKKILKDKFDYDINKYKHKYTLVKVNEYINHIKIKLPFLFNENTCIAGGCLQTLIDGKDLSLKQDIDVFLFNFDESKLKALVEKIILYCDVSEVFVSDLSISIKIMIDNFQVITLQLIKHNYESMEKLICGFDIPVCSIAYYENKLYMTTKCYYSLN